MVCQVLLRCCITRVIRWRGEAPIEGFDKLALVQGLHQSGHRSVEALDHESDLPALIRARAQRGDMVICLGTGSISTWANDLAANLRDLEGA